MAIHCEIKTLMAFVWTAATFSTLLSINPTGVLASVINIYHAYAIPIRDTCVALAVFLSISVMVARMSVGGESLKLFEIKRDIPLRMPTLTPLNPKMHKTKLFQFVTKLSLFS